MLVYEEDNKARWEVTKKFEIPATAKVLGISCSNIHSQKGIIASISDGRVTDTSWECTSDRNSDWYGTSTFAHFDDPVIIGKNGDNPWRMRQNILENASWIWAQGTTNWAGCKLALTPDSRSLKMAKCTEFCSKNACLPDMDTKIGCNQMFNCPQACKMRDLGLTRSECKIYCNSNGISGCNPTVNGWTFQLCHDCNRDYPGCTSWPTTYECEQGCDAYD